MPRIALLWLSASNEDVLNALSDSTRWCVDWTLDLHGLSLPMLGPSWARNSDISDNTFKHLLGVSMGELWFSR